MLFAYVLHINETRLNLANGSVGNSSSEFHINSSNTSSNSNTNDNTNNNDSHLTPRNKQKVCQKG